MLDPLGMTLYHFMKVSSQIYLFFFVFRTGLPSITFSSFFINFWQTYQHLTLHFGMGYHDREMHVERQRKFREDERQLELAIPRTKEVGLKMQKELGDVRTRIG